MEEWVTVAVLGKPRGIRGELTAFSYSDHPERFEHLTKVTLHGSAGARQVEVESSWFHQGSLIFKLKGIDSIEDAEALTGAEVRIPFAERAPLDPGEFYRSDLIGCEVRHSATKVLIGEVTGFEEGGTSGLLQVGPKILIPFTREICVDIAPARREILVALPEGLLEING